MAIFDFTLPGAGAVLAVALALLTAPTCAAESADPMARGKAIYVEQCATCHGAEGQGESGAYEAELVGDASVGELAAVIGDTMPEGEPELCVDQDAKAVAQYIHETFYSEAARLRNRPPQQQLSRLTAEQLQQSLADMYEHFFGSAWTEKKRGLSANYFNAGRWDKDKLKVERIDPAVDFDFGREAPVEGVTPDEFYIHWAGSLRVDHTGRYEIVVRSTCSFKLRFGHRDNTLINNHVQSEGKTEFRKALNLIAGRQYPLLIDFTQRKRKTEMPPANISLCWVPPGGVEEVIPPENLVPATMPNTFALQAKLPPDDESYGYARGTSVNRQWEDAVTQAALEFGVAAEKELWPQYKRKHRKDSNENRQRLRDFLAELIGVAFRQPIDEETRKIYIDKQLDAVDDDGQAIRRVCLLAINSPRFLYPTLDQQAPASNRVATRLALTLYDSLPSDEWLLKEIQKDQLNPEQPDAREHIREVATRMTNDARLHGKVMEMFFHWLDVDPSAEITKDQDKFEGFDRALVLDLRRSLERSLSDVFWSDASDYRQLFVGDRVWTNQRLNEFYGPAWDPEESHDAFAMVRSKPAPGERYGVLTHPMVMSHLSYYDTTSPIHRGVFLIRRVLGRTLRPPNEAFTPINPELHPDLTTRERVILQTGESKCQVCHEKINGLGFTLENFDAVGRYRTTEKDKPIDATGGYVSQDGTQVDFGSAEDLARYLAESEDAQRAFVEVVFEHFVKQPLAAYGSETAERLVKQFRESDFNMRRLIVEVAVTAAIHPHQQEKANESA
ncbi:DUF1588 domain-containing protein [Roseiconus nitratireducens]|uniref:DUF1588 domain-containing protein n=1 Tax=Roseiconus nitratireducens TaxID=2605748 RepID=A0A5M6DDG6_9BACT|nr:DUF1588 domain-containing protein [Roseiconus nitratireducens]KAA5543225.1 DUF1588 domain-containing protein [Roseiconus nitratireducens]